MRLLLVSLDNLGDLVFVSSLAAPLAKAFPNGQWAILCKDYAADIARQFPLPGVQVMAADPWWDRAPGRKEGQFFPFLKALKACRRFSPDVVIVTSTNWRAAAMARLLGAAKVIGFDRGKSALFFTHRVSAQGWSDSPITTLLSRLLRPLGLDFTTEKDLPLGLSRAFAREQFSQLVQRQYILLHPFAGDLKRCWPLEHWLCLALALRQKGYLIVWMGRDDEVSPLRAALCDVGQDIFLCDINQGRLINTMLVSRHAVCLIGHDSGPLHFTTALGTPVVGLYLPSLFPKTVTHGVGAQRILHRVSPQRLAYDDVWAATQSLLQEIQS